MRIPDQNETIFLKVTLQVVRQVPSERGTQLVVVGRCEPDHRLNSRSRFLRHARSSEVPAAWLN
jgi:hypothetical protein